LVLEEMAALLMEAELLVQILFSHQQHPLVVDMAVETL
jgi:hypothetical protein